MSSVRSSYYLSHQQTFRRFLMVLHYEEDERIKKKRPQLHDADLLRPQELQGRQGRSQKTLHRPQEYESLIFETDYDVSRTL